MMGTRVIHTKRSPLALLLAIAALHCPGNLASAQPREANAEDEHTLVIYVDLKMTGTPQEKKSTGFPEWRATALETVKEVIRSVAEQELDQTISRKFVASEQEGQVYDLTKCAAVLRLTLRQKPKAASRPLPFTPPKDATKAGKKAETAMETEYGLSVVSESIRIQVPRGSFPDKTIKLKISRWEDGQPTEKLINDMNDQFDKEFRRVFEIAKGKEPSSTELRNALDASLPLCRAFPLVNPKEPKEDLREAGKRIWGPPVGYLRLNFDKCEPISSARFDIFVRQAEGQGGFHQIRSISCNHEHLIGQNRRGLHVQHEKLKIAGEMKPIVEDIHFDRFYDFVKADRRAYAVIFQRQAAGGSAALMPLPETQVAATLPPPSDLRVAIAAPRREP
jgi:hypothetical protein